MHKIIHNLRQRPEEHRRHILHVTTLVAAVIMLSLWVFSLGHSLSNTDITKNIKKDAEPISALKANIIDGYKSMSQ